MRQLLYSCENEGWEIVIDSSVFQRKRGSVAKTMREKKKGKRPQRLWATLGGQVLAKSEASGCSLPTTGRIHFRVLLHEVEAGRELSGFAKKENHETS